MEMDTSLIQSPILDRMERVVQKVRERLLRATTALDIAGVAYAVIGGNAVGAWVAKVDESWVRTTQDVDLLVRRCDFELVKKTLETEGFRYRHAASIDMFLDGPHAKARDAIHVIFANEKVREEYVEPAPDVEPHEIAPPYRILALESLVRMKLTSNRDKDRTHVRDMIAVGLIDSSWPDRFHPVLAERLRGMLDTPNG
jgi:hypothetical protein